MYLGVEIACPVANALSAILAREKFLNDSVSLVKNHTAKNATRINMFAINVR